jgi:hypothetical protein
MIIAAAAKVTCRDCMGFGHSAKKCPTGRKWDGLRVADPLMQKVVAGFRAYAQSVFFPDVDLPQIEHPLGAFYKKYYTTGNATALKLDTSGKHAASMALVDRLIVA